MIARCSPLCLRHTAWRTHDQPLVLVNGVEQLPDTPIPGSATIREVRTPESRISVRSKVGGRRPSSGTADGGPGVSPACQHLYQLLAEHAAADRVQEEVDGDATDVQNLRVVAGDQHRDAADTQRPVQLEFDEPDEEVKEYRQVGEHVAG